MKYFKGDLLEAFESGEVSCIAHQVNCQGVMGSGIAKQIKEKYPQHFMEYKEYLEGLSQYKPLGTAVETYIFNKGVIYGLLAQDRYGKDKRHTNYAAFARSLDFINYRIVGIPKYIGCGLGGGDWNIVEAILKDYEEMEDCEFYVYEL